MTSLDSFDIGLRNHINGSSLQSAQSNYRLEFVNMTLLKDDGYVQQFTRPIDVRLDDSSESHLMDISNTVARSRTQATDDMLVGIASKIFMPTLRPDGVRMTDLKDGWGMERFSFSLIIDRYDNDQPSVIRRYTITGYTDRQEMSLSNIVDPKTEFVIDKCASTTVTRRHNEMGLSQRYFGSESVNILRSSGAGSLFTGQKEYIQSPDSLFHAAGIMETYRSNDLVPREDVAGFMQQTTPASSMLTDRPRYLVGGQTTPQGILSKTLTSLVSVSRDEAVQEAKPHTLEGNQNFMHGTELARVSPLMRAEKLLKSDATTREYNTILAYLNGKSNSVSNVFTLETLNRLFGQDLQDKIKVIKGVGGHFGMDADSWAASSNVVANYEAAVADAIRNAIPRIMAEAGLVGLDICVESRPSGFASNIFTDVLSMLEPSNYNIECMVQLAVMSPTTDMIANAEMKAKRLVLQYVVAEYFNPGQAEFSVAINAGAVTPVTVAFKSEMMSGQARRFTSPSWSSSINTYMVTGDHNQFYSNVHQMGALRHIAKEVTGCSLEDSSTSTGFVDDVLGIASVPSATVGNTSRFGF